MTQPRLDLPSLFGAVAQALAQNQQALDQADEVNHDHGTNMVQTFKTITQALQAKQGKSDSVALAYAAKKLANSSTSSSGKLYAQGLAQAASQFKGKRVDQCGAMDLLQTLIGGGQAAQPAGGDLLGSLLGGMAGGQAQPSAPSGGGDLLGSLLGGLAGGQAQPSAPSGGGDLLGSLLGGLAGGEQPQPQTSPQSAGGDLLGTLLGGLAGGEQAQPQTAPQSAGGGDLLGALLGGMTGGNASTAAGAGNGLDLGDLLNAGMAFLQAKQSGAGTMQALVQAFMSVSGMGRSAHRTESTELVINSFLQALASSAGAKP